MQLFYAQTSPSSPSPADEDSPAEPAGGVFCEPTQGGPTCTSRVLRGPLAIDSAGRLSAARPRQDGEPAEPAIAVLLPHTQGTRRRVLLLTLDPTAIRVGGLPPLPLVELRRGDELRVAGNSLFFSDEMPLEVVAFESARHGQDRTTTNCSRCHQPVREGEPVVCCPRCGLIYMAQDQSPNCWTFGPCLGCGREPQAVHSWHPQATAVGAERQRRSRGSARHA